jgi:hypothetical protein
MSRMTFEEYCSDIIGMDPYLMNEEQLLEARKGFYEMTHRASAKPARPATKPLSEKASTARATAKAFGGKALKGTAKQKEWAEKIRAEKLSGMTEEQAKMVSDPMGILGHSKFWIENRNATPSSIAEFVAEQKSLLAKYNETGDIYTAEKYNRLTKKWGF